MRILYFILFVVFTLFHININAQNFDLNLPQKVENISIFKDGQYIAIQYELMGFEKNDNLIVGIDLYQNDSEKINAKSFTGDHGMIKGGGKKKILWDYQKDEIFVNEKISAKIYVINFPKISYVNHISKSMLLPGLGNYKLSPKKPFVLKGIGFYAGIGTSVLMNHLAFKNFENYLTSSSANEADSYFKKSKNYKNASYLLAATAGVVWAIDIATVVNKVRKVKSQPKSFIESEYYKTDIRKSHIFAKSESRYVNTKAAIKPPMLTFLETTVKFVDEDNDNCIYINEKAHVEFIVKNLGKGPAINAYASVKFKNNVKGLNYNNKIPLGDINISETKTVVIPLEGTKDLAKGEQTMEVTIIEANEYNSVPLEISFKTLSFLEPNIVVVDSRFSTEGGKAEIGKIITLSVMIQNIGLGEANKIGAEFILPNNVGEISDLYFYYDKMKPNEKSVINLEFAAKRTYEGNIIPIKLNLSESNGKYAEKNKVFQLELNKSLEKTKINFESNYVAPVIEVASLTSDVDKDIPLNQNKINNRYALIIGNEDYKSFQTGLSDEVNVKFAQRDAKTFKEYCEKTLGIPEENMFYRENATSALMKSEIKRISEILSKDKDAELIFYYAGHGFPDEETKIPYLIPVDVSASNLNNAIPLYNMYKQFSETNASKIIIFIDACFSGGGRESGLLAARGVKIAPKIDNVTGNMVIFTASQGNQSALPYEKQYHGLFTYHLLSKIKETKGKINLNDLSDYIKTKVELDALKINKKEQVPAVLYSNDIENEWKTWTLY